MTRHLPENERRAQLLRSARAVFVEKGYLAARMSDIAARAGLSKGAVYFYYKSKHDLFLALVRDEQEVTWSFLEKTAADERPAPLVLLQLARDYLTYFAGLKSPPRFFLMMTEQGIRDEQIRDEVLVVHQRFIEAAAHLHGRGVAEGTFRPTDSVAVAQLIKAMVDGLAGQSAIGLRPDQDRLSTAGLDLLLRGLLTDEARALLPALENPT